MSNSVDHARAEILAGRFTSALAILTKKRDPSEVALSLNGEIAVAEALQLTGKTGEAVERAERGIQAKDRTDVTDAQCLSILALAAFEKGDVGKSLKTFQRAQRVAQRAQDWRQVCRIQLDMIANLSDLGGPESVAGALRECQTNVANLGHPHLKARLHVTIAQVEGKRGHLQQAEEHLKVAQGVLLAAPNVWLEGLIRLNSSTICGLKAELPEGLRLAEKALESAEASGHMRTKLGAIANLAYLSLLDNDIPTARRRCIEGLGMAEQFSEIKIALLETLAQATLAKLQRSECFAILSEIEQEAVGEEQFRRNWYHVAAALTEVRLHHQDASWLKALATGETGMETADHRRDTLHQVSLRVLGADSLAELGRFDEAAALILEASDLADDVPVAVLAEVERARAAVLARTVGRDAARRQFERSLRILSAMGGIAPRMDAAMSYQRAMQQMNVGLREHIKAQPWNLKPLVDHTLPGKTQPDNSKSRTVPRGVEITDLLWLGRLVWKPNLLAQEAFVLLRESDHTTAVAVVERAKGHPERVTACEGWSVEQARGEAASPRNSIKMPLGTAHDTALELLVEAADTLHSRTFVRDFARYIHQARTLSAFQEAEREQLSLMSPQALFASEDGVFTSESMRKLVATAKTVAATDVPILITGETGTGKEVLARLVHKYSGRADKDFLPYNCAGVPKDMVESQLFGHKRGAFTSAHESSLGVVRTVDGGTLLLDEVGEIELGIQPKLLRFLDNKEVHPLGEARPVKVDVRIIAATNANLDDLVRKGLFREDLLYRINVVTLELPPLRERREEILPLAHHFLRRFGTDTGRPNLRITEDAQKCLLLHEWPGNVRRLANELRRAVALTEGDGPVGLAQLSPDVIEAGRAIGETVLSAGVEEGQTVTIQTNQRLADAVAHLEHVMIRRTLKRVDGHMGLAARALGISRKGLYLKRRRLGFDDL